MVHAVAQRPLGPYVLADVALGPRAGAWDGLTQHNPSVQRDAVTGTYLLYYMGSTDNGTVTTGGGACADSPQTKPGCNQRVGLATATHPAGPWTRRSFLPFNDTPTAVFLDQKPRFPILLAVLVSFQRVDCTMHDALRTGQQSIGNSI